MRGKLIDTDGIAKIDGVDYNDRDYFKRGMQGETVVSDPLIGKADGELILIFAAPVWENGLPDTTVVGVVFLVMQPDLLNNIVESIHISKNCGAYIINQNGTSVAHTTEGMVEKQNNTIALSKTDSSLKKIASLEQKMIAGEAGFDTYSYGGVSKFLSYAPIANTGGWSLGINAPVSDFTKDTVIGIMITILLAIVCISIASYIAVKVGISIGTPIRLCAERLNKIVDGDLHSPVPEVDTKDEVGILSSSTKQITEGLNSIIQDIHYQLDSMAKGNFSASSAVSEKYVGNYKTILDSMYEIKEELGGTLSSIKESAEQVSLGSTQLAENSQSLAEGAVEELTATIENVTTLAKQSAEGAVQAYQLVDTAVDDAKSNEQSMAQLTEAMANINVASQKIQDIITTIEDIASQTNLLSLNASIEAARAGESGRGFAVVAEQIGKLASDSAQSAVDTRDLIIKVLEEIKLGSQLTDDTVLIFDSIVKSMTKFSELAHASSEASDQQAMMLDQVEQGVEQISIVVQSNSASAEETSATSEELAAQADTMRNLVDKFTF